MARVRTLLAQTPVQQISDMRHFMADLCSAAIELQITELALAHSMLDQAKFAQEEATAQRLRRKASKIFQSVVRMLERLHPTPEQQSRINWRLDMLKQRLAKTFD
jgi:hypothetical protein